MSSLETSARLDRPSLDFWKFWAGETTSNLGSSFTEFALPLLVFKLTGSALNLGIATAATFLPYLFFGLVIGAWIDRLDRKRVMLLVDLSQVLVISSIPLAFWVGALSIWWVYAVAFVSGTLKITFEVSQFAAIPSLVNQNDLLKANGRLQASFFGATILGPLLAGTLLFVMPVPLLLLIDAGTFLISACMLSLITTRFNSTPQREQQSIRQDVVEGLRYVFHHPILRNIAVMLALINFLAISRETQLVLLAERQLHATDVQFGLLNAAGGVGVVIITLLAGTFRKRWSLMSVWLNAMRLTCLATVALAFMPNIWLAMPIWAMMMGLDILANICTGSLRQAIVPNHMLGRVQSTAYVMSHLALPLGALLGGTIINVTGSVMLVYAGMGVLMFLVVTGFASFSALRHAEHYLPREQEQSRSESEISIA